MTEFDPKPEIVNEPLPEPDSRVPEGFDAGEFCVHEIKPEIIKNGMGPDAMRLRGFGHKVGEDESDEEIFSTVCGVPNMAVFASRILDEIDNAGPLTQMITAIALQREIEKSEPKATEEAPNPMEALAALLGSLVPGGSDVQIIPMGDFVGGGSEEESDETSTTGVKYAGTNDPVRILDLGGPSKTFAPIDNRDEYPGIGEGGYL